MNPPSAKSTVVTTSVETLGSHSGDEQVPVQKPGDGYVQSFARGLAVIRSFSSQAPEQTLSAVAAATGLTRAGARRILLTLQTLGYVKSDGKYYQLTPRIMELGFAYLSSTPLWNLAEPVMERLSDEIRESCSAAVLDGDEVVYVLRVHTHKIMSTNLSVGSRLPACWTSLGRVLLSALAPQQLEQVMAERQRKQFTRHTLQDDAALRNEIAQVRRQGWCLLNQELEEGLISIAAPIFNARGETVAALNISGQANRTTPDIMREQMLPRLLSAASEVSRLVAMQPRR